MCMNRVIKTAVQFLLAGVFLIAYAVPGFAAEIRRVPGYDSVEQGFMALTLDVEGAENFRYTGLENKMHVYRGKIKPESKLKFVITAALGGSKTLPITGRSSTVIIQIVAKKGGEVIKKENPKKDNRSSLSLNYTVPKGADTLEVSETFVLKNKSRNKAYNKTVTSRNKLILSTSDAVAPVAAVKNAGSGTKESRGFGSGMLAGAVVAVAAIGGGAFFCMKKRKGNQTVTAEMAQKEKLNQQAIRHQQEMQQQDLQREAQQQRLVQEQNVIHQQPGTAGTFAVGTTGVTGSMQNDETESALNNLPDTAHNFCHNCGARVKPGSRFCGECGARNAPEFCANCGTKLAPDSKFCANCGAKV